MYYFYVEIEYIATKFSPARTDLAVKLLISNSPVPKITLFSPKIRLVMTISQLLLPQIVNLFCPIFHLIMAQYQLLLSQKSPRFVP